MVQSISKNRCSLQKYPSLLAHVKLAFSLRLRFSIVPPSDASPINVKLLALSVDIILGKNLIES